MGLYDTPRWGIFYSYAKLKGNESDRLLELRNKTEETSELRSLYLDFFRSKDHHIEPSASLVPQNDKSLLLINAGMAPLKPYFQGTTSRKGAPFWFGSTRPYIPTARIVRGCIASSRRSPST